MATLEFQVKICGITSPEDARRVAEAGADAIGLNFYPRSPRCVDLPTARSIRDVLPQGVVVVGVFVHADDEQIRALAESVGLDWVQLHGDESLAQAQSLRDLPLIRAVRCEAEPDPSVAENWRSSQPWQAVLLDAHHPTHYGGTGRTLAWERWASLGPRSLPLILAGGLCPENVDLAIRAVRPDAVDVASGVERRPGVKDVSRVRLFVEAARRAFAEL